MSTDKIKYPRTYHLPFSPGLQNDDRLIESLDSFVGKEIVVTEKMDGENTTLYKDHMHARSLDSAHNFTRNWVKKMHATIGQDIPVGWRLCGENVAYYHSIEYNNLDSFFYLFSIWNEKNNCLSWDETLEWAKLLDLATPREFYRGTFSEEKLKEISLQINTKTTEGFVARLTESFSYNDFNKKVVKFVRAEHIQSEEHWLKNTYPNKLKDSLKVKPAFMATQSLKIK